MTADVIFWDFDGTLAHRPGMGSTCLLECLSEAAGQPTSLTVVDIRPHLKNGFPWHRHDSGHEHLTDARAWWAELTPIFERAYGSAGVHPDLAERAAHLVSTRYLQPDRWSVYPDSRDALASVAAAGWRNVILSNHVPELAELVTALGLGDHIDKIFTSAATGWEKPNPRFFRHALQVMGNPARAWMVGDNPIADVAGAEAVGIPALLVRPPGLQSAVETIGAASRCYGRVRDGRADA